ncbi:MAG: PAS domain-containing protein [Gemmatimonadaceae bacterium]|nr:PAS domain-containing protein [Gemmatimonadaceae bacterium]
MESTIARPTSIPRALSSYARRIPLISWTLEQLEVIAIDDAIADARTSEFADSYLRPLGITAMLDAPVLVGGVANGVLCHEHVGSVRPWTEDERVFALTMANLVSLALEGWERQKAATELHDAQNRLQRAVSAGNVGLWDWDLGTNEVFYSPEWKQQLGYEVHELSDNFAEWETRLHPDDRERALEAVQAYRDDPGGHFELQVRLRHKSGSSVGVVAVDERSIDVQYHGRVDPSHPRCRPRFLPLRRQARRRPRIRRRCHRPPRRRRCRADALRPPPGCRSRRRARPDRCPGSAVSPLRSPSG